VKAAAVYVALAGLTMTLVDLPRSTLALIERGKVESGQLLKVQSGALAELERLGIPPDPPTLEHLRAAVATSEEIAAEERDRTFYRAQDLADYLVPFDERPTYLRTVRVRSLLGQAFDDFQQRAHPWPLLLSAPLRLHQVADEPAELSDQLERFLAARWTLLALEGAEPIQLRRFKLVRDEAGILCVEITILAPLSEAIAFWTAWMGEAGDAPPRRVREHGIRRLGAAEWGLRTHDFDAPPVELHAVVGMPAPSKRRGT
jgi:hypothetical protein